MPLGIVKESDYLKELGIQNEQSISDSPNNPENIPAEKVEHETIVPNQNGTIDEQCSVSGEVIDVPKGRGTGNTEVPNSVRKLIAGAAIEEGRPAGLAIAQFLGISDSSVSAYTKGATSTASYDKPNQKLTDFLGETRKRITKKAGKKLMLALNEIKDEKVTDLDAVEASNVAKNMAAIIKSMEPQDKNQGVNINMPQITIYRPEFAREDNFRHVSSPD